MKNKILSFGLICTLLCLFAISSQAEARSHFSLNVGAVIAPPAERYVVEPYPCYYAPPAYAYPAPAYAYPAPAYAYPAPVYPARPMYIAPRPVYREAYVAPRPYVEPGISFSWYR